MELINATFIDRRYRRSLTSADRMRGVARQRERASTSGIVCNPISHARSSTAKASVVKRKGDLAMDGRMKVDVNTFRRRLQGWYVLVRMWLVNSALKLGAIYRLKSTYLPVLVICLGCPMLFAACADNDPGESSKHSRHQHRQGTSGSGDYGHSGPDRSGTPIPSL